MKRFTTHATRPLRLLLALMILVLAAPARSADFPGGVTPDDALASVDLLDRVLDEILGARGVAAPPAPPFDEAGLGPFHAYQMVVACSSRIQQFDDTVGVAPLPTVVASPRQYSPRDVAFVADLMIENLRAAGTSIGLSDLPTDKQAFTGKTPQDVFRRAMDVFLKLNALNGQSTITPSEMFAEMRRAGEDVRSILFQADPASRYRVDAPRSEPGRTPADVLKLTLAVREQINDIRRAAGLKPVPVPSMPIGRTINPIEPFFQIQIIIADMNVVKMQLGTTSVTPIPVAVTGKTPTDVHQEGSLVSYLLGQVSAASTASASR